MKAVLPRMLAGSTPTNELVLPVLPPLPKQKGISHTRTPRGNVSAIGAERERGGELSQTGDAFDPLDLQAGLGWVGSELGKEILDDTRDGIWRRGRTTVPKTVLVRSISC